MRLFGILFVKRRQPLQSAFVSEHETSAEQSYIPACSSWFYERLSLISVTTEAISLWSCPHYFHLSKDGGLKSNSFNWPNNFNLSTTKYSVRCEVLTRGVQPWVSPVRQILQYRAACEGSLKILTTMGRRQTAKLLGLKYQISSFDNGTSYNCSHNRCWSTRLLHKTIASCWTAQVIDLEVENFTALPMHIVRLHRRTN